MLYIVSPWLLYFVTASLYQLISLTYFTHPTNSLSSGNRLFFASLSLFCSLICFVSQIQHTSEIIWCWFSSIWLILLSIIPSKPSHVVKNVKIPSSCMAVHSMHASALFTHLLMGTWLVYTSWLLWIILQWTDITVHLSFWINVFIFFKYLSRSGTDESYGNSISNFLRNLHTDFHIDFTNLHSHQQCTSTPFSPRPHQHLLLFVILILVILTDVNSCLIVVLICISLIVMLGIFSCVCWPSLWLLWENVYSKEDKMSGPLPNFWFCCSFFFYVELYDSFIYFDYWPVSHISSANILSHSKGCCFILLIISFTVQKLFSLIWSYLFIFYFVSLA